MFFRLISSVVKNKIYLNYCIIIQFNDELIFIETFTTFFYASSYQISTCFLKTSFIPFRYMHNLETREDNQKYS